MARLALILQASCPLELSCTRSSRTSWDESFEILPQAGITRIDVRSADPARHEYGIDLRDEPQQVFVRVTFAMSRVVLLALFVKVRVAINEKAPLLGVES